MREATPQQPGAILKILYLKGIQGSKKLEKRSIPLLDWSLRPDVSGGSPPREVCTRLYRKKEKKDGKNV
jgi:hypothetical protein